MIEALNMKCPHCGIHFHDNWVTGSIDRGVGATYGGDKEPVQTGWLYRTAICPGCSELTIELSTPPTHELVGGTPEEKHAFAKGHREWGQVHPIGSNRGPVPPEVPEPI